MKKCLECGSEFKTLAGLNRHIKSSYGLQEYYHKHHPRYNLYNGQLLTFVNYKDYFNKEFENPQQKAAWVKKISKEEFLDWVVKLLKRRVEEKQLNYFPNFNYFLTVNDLPKLSFVENKIGDIEILRDRIGLPFLFKPCISLDFKTPDDLTVLIDTREQKPLKFKKSKKFKLDFGDYSLGGREYNYTYVDRKSEGDFLSTMVSGYERFKRELEKAVLLDCFLYVVVESSINKIQNANRFRKNINFNLPLVFKNMRDLENAYPQSVQFIFTGNRGNSEKIIPPLLFHGKYLWENDVQYFLHHNSTKS